jgi:hypothetical protein
MLAYGVDMEMTQSGKVTPLVELMASVFFACECRMEIRSFTYRSPHVLTDKLQSLAENSYPVLRGSPNCDFSLPLPPLETLTKPLLGMATTSWKVCSTRGSSARRLKRRERQMSVYDSNMHHRLAVLTGCSVIAPQITLSSLARRS